ncbi:hypothetical protein BCR42DRAFT_444428 [Absidia repens]|uniref:Uncharacterized protein n=1 Tax=Absidia repens TaxID=90262 RepID=A0A1X2HR93_9FUNG|nr:hypothetical protein BCR42DRAFT_444428 [Absidia repens]
MNSSWNVTEQDQEIYLENMVNHHFDIYQAHAFSERQHYWSKHSTLNNHLVPNLLELIHLKMERPSSALGYVTYRRERRRFLVKLLQNSNRRHINAVIRKVADSDEWDQNAGVAFPGEGHVDHNMELANLFGLGELMAWATTE